MKMEKVKNMVLNFMQYRRIAAIFSIALVVISIFSISFKGLNLGLDFVGGTQIELQLDKVANLGKIRNIMQEQELEGVTVVNFGSAYEILIRTRDNVNDGRAKQLIQLMLDANLATDIELLKVEYIGPQIGEELREDGGIGMFVALLLVMLYVALKFQYKFSIAAVIALFHDVIVTIGIFSMFQLNFDLTVVAAVLAIIGYSLNDTIVVSDRIRENIRLSKKHKDTITIINESLSQILNRTLITSLTTLLVILILLAFGGETLKSLSIAFAIGIVIGTYSSIYIASNVLILLGFNREDMLEKKNKDND